MSERLRARRAEQTAELGAAAPDELISAYRCGACGGLVGHDRPVRVPAAPYDGLASLVAHARAAAEAGRAGEVPPRCATCGVGAEWTHTDVHAYCEPPGRDVVVRLRGPARAVTFSWCPTGGFEPLEGLDDAGQRALALSAQVRSAAGNKPRRTARLEGRLRRSLVKAPADPRRLDLVPALLEEGRTATASAVARAHVERYPDDPRGRIVLSACLRQREEDGRAWEVLEEVLARDPDHGPAHYNLALIALDYGDAEAALPHLEAGERAEPDDPDYPVGRVLALLLLDDDEGARAALARARELDPAHPRLPDLGALLGE